MSLRLCTHLLTLPPRQLAHHDRDHCLVHLESESRHRSPPQPQVLVRDCLLRHSPTCMTQVGRRGMLRRPCGLHHLLLCVLGLDLCGAYANKACIVRIADSHSPFSVSLIALTSKNTVWCCLYWLRCALERSCGLCPLLEPSGCASARCNAVLS